MLEGLDKISNDSLVTFVNTTGFEPTTGVKDFSLFLVLTCNFFLKGLWPGEII